MDGEGSDVDLSSFSLRRARLLPHRRRPHRRDRSGSFSVDDARRFFRWFNGLSDDDQRELLAEQPKWALEKLCRNRLQAYNSVFRDKKVCRRPDHLRKGYTFDEVKRIVDEYTNPLHLAAFLWQLYTCTRIGELRSVRLFGKDLVVVDTPKTARSGNKEKILPLYGVLPDIVCALPWVRSRTSAYLKKVQVSVLRRLGEGFNPVYAYSSPTDKFPLGVPLYQFSTHSCRYTLTDWAGEAGIDPFYIACLRNDKVRNNSSLPMQYHYRHYKPERLRGLLSPVVAWLDEYLRDSGKVDAIRRAAVGWASQE